MSDGNAEPHPGRSWRFFLDDMIAFAGDVLRYVAGLDQAAFERNGLVFDATLRKMELIGEARSQRAERDPCAGAKDPLAPDHRSA